MTELEKKYLKKINGKTVVYVNGRFKCEAILLWEPGGEVISVKPTLPPEKLLALLHEGGFRRFTLSGVSSREFCLATHGVFSPENNLVLERLAALDDGAEYGFLSVTDGIDPEPLRRLLSPRCPY